MERCYLVGPACGGAWTAWPRDAGDLRAALAAIRGATAGRIYGVLARPAAWSGPSRSLIEAAEEGCDRLILTAPGLKRPAPDEDLDELQSACRRPGRVRLEPNRAAAILAAAEVAAPGDGLLLVTDAASAIQDREDLIALLSRVWRGRRSA